MNNKKYFLCSIVSLLSLSFLVACNSNKNTTSEEPKPIEIGDTVKEWRTNYDLDSLPLGLADTNSKGEIVKDFGNYDNSSLKYEVKKSNNMYLGSDLLEEPYFVEDDAKNGDIISLYVYVPSEGNISSFQLEVFPSSMNNSIKSDLLEIDSSLEQSWNRLMISFDTLETLGAIRLNYQIADGVDSATFFVDNINITLGEETVKTDYVYNDESLYKAYEPYLKVGTCMSGRMLANTELRKITQHNFNSITAENEGKPEQILDQAACQELAKTDETQVAIRTSPFEKIYNYAEAHHIGVRHHTFVWFDQTPQWFFRKNYDANGAVVSKSVMVARMENFIKTALETINSRWPGLVYAIDVSNEGVQNGGIRKKDNNNMNPNYWYETIGDDFVYYAFKFARQYAEEGQELYYNDYAYDYDTNNCKFALNTLLKDAIAEELIDGVGIQGHLDTNNFSLDAVIKDAEMIKEKGLKCQITELDITVNSESTADLNNQKNAFKRLGTRVLESNASGKTEINAIVFWGIRDDLSWKRNQHPLLFNANYAKKPAYYGFLEAVEEYLPEQLEGD
ncbi:MAG: endo-1,4-beta-xylanase [Bacilli bacterium]|nr:endo-1,4-beta-xylanase [Bacilli bacterium]